MVFSTEGGRRVSPKEASRRLSVFPPSFTKGSSEPLKSEGLAPSELRDKGLMMSWQLPEPMSLSRQRETIFEGSPHRVRSEVAHGSLPLSDQLHLIVLVAQVWVGQSPA